jgi:hypothetical protein
MYKKEYVSPKLEIYKIRRMALLSDSYGARNSETSSETIDETPVEFGD